MAGPTMAGSAVWASAYSGRARMMSVMSSTRHRARLLTVFSQQRIFIPRAATYIGAARMAIAALAVTAALASLAPVVARAEDWPQFRGPGGQGASVETGLPLQWSESRNVKWKAPVPGRGWSSPVVAGDRVWLTTAVDDGDISLRALAFDVETGREVVSTEVFRKSQSPLLNLKNSWASPTPIIDGDRVYVHFGAEGTAALTTAGEVVWKARFPYESQHGGGGSPAIYGDLLIFSCDGSDTAFVVALDKRTGTGSLEDPAPPARGPGVLDAARDSGRRSRSAGQRRRLPCRRLRSGLGPRDLAGELWRRLLERAASGVRPRTGLHLDRLPGALAAGRACRTAPAT